MIGFKKDYEFGDYKFDEAEKRKERLRIELGTLFDYAEEFRGLKDEVLPPEYHELAKAKKLLRPYWRIQDEIEKIFGKPKTEWQQKQQDKRVRRARERMRKQWAFTNPEALRLWELFYTEKGF